MTEEIVPYEAMAMVARAEVVAFAEIVVKSGLAPKSFDNKEKVLMALAFGRELGISPMQSLQGLNVINGRIGVGGDLAKALCDRPGVTINDVMAGTGDDYGCTVAINHNDKPPLHRTFTIADAKKAKLWGRNGPWSDYPDRMLYYRALGFALRDAFPNVLKGLKTTEELMDYPDAQRPTAYERAGKPPEPPKVDVKPEPVVTPEPKRRRRKETVDETPAPVIDETPAATGMGEEEPPLSAESEDFIDFSPPPQGPEHELDPHISNLCSDIRERLRLASYNEARLMRTLSSDYVKYKTAKGFVKADWKLEQFDEAALQKLLKHWGPLLDLIRKETGA